MDVEVLASAERAAARAAAIIAAKLRAAIAARRRAVLALSGGRTPTPMLRSLAAADVAWCDVHVFQVDERVVPAADPRRNLGAQREFAATAALPAGQLHAMPVEAPDLHAAARAYEMQLTQVAGRPAVIDVVHLGLGEDGHTASLVPGDAALDAAGDVAVTGRYHGTRRMTLTLQALDRARHRVWLVTGPAKRDALERLIRRDPALIATRVSDAHSLLVSDPRAAGAPHG